MPSYRLLRSNKESGPYSLNDLLTLGLKAYDLIWVDGRSAAWRYPSEVAELKDYAPAIEEQPYDRFYKKSSESETAEKESTDPRYKEPVQQTTPAREHILKQESTVRQYQERVQNPVRENIVKQEEVVKQQPVETIAKEEPVIKPPGEIANPSYQNYQPKLQPKPELPAVSATSQVQQSQPETPAVAEGLQQAQQPKKKVFVSMPEGFNHYQQEQYQQYLPKPKAVQEDKPSYAVQEKIPVQKPSYPSGDKSYSPINIHEPEEATLETKYTQSLDDIKEMYINTLVQRKTRNRRKEIFRKYLKPALVPLFLVISGVAIGFVINYRKSPRVVQSLSTVTPPQTTPPQNEQALIDEKTQDQILQPEDKQNAEEKQNIGEKQNLVLNTDNKSRKQSKLPTQVSIESQKHNKNSLLLPKAVVPEKKQKENFIPDDEVASYQKKEVQVNPTTGERTRSIRDNEGAPGNKESTADRNSSERAKKENSEPAFSEPERKNSIRDFVSVKTNNYVRGAFGGIRGLELMVYNTSDFLVDEVSIELQIMKPSEQPLRTDIITVRNISANRAVRIRVPDSQRGIRVDYRITHVESRQWQRNTAGL
jgi:hypothetical protein